MRKSELGIMKIYISVLKNILVYQYNDLNSETGTTGLTIF